MTLIFYLFIDMFAVLFAYLADRSITVSERSYIQASNIKFRGRKIKKYQIYFFLSFLVLFLVTALRENVGADYAGYSNAFLHINAGNLSTAEKNWLSIGYRWLCRLIGIINSNSYVLMFAVVAFITIYYFYKAIYKVSINWSLSIYLFISFCLFYQCFNQIRQMMAMAISMYAYRYIKENNNIKFVVYIGIAVLFHPSAVVMAAIFVVRKWQMCFKNYCIYFAACIVAYFGFDIIIKLLEYTNYGNTYLSWAKYNTSFEASSILNLGVRIILLVGCLIFAKETIRRKPYCLGLYNSVIICTVLQVLTLKSYLFGRITTYFFGMYIFLIPEVLETIKKHVDGKNYRLIQIFVFLFLFAYHMVYYFSSSGASGSGYAVYNSLLF